MNKISLLFLLIFTNNSFAQLANVTDTLYNTLNGEKIYNSKELTTRASYPYGESSMYNFLLKNLKYPESAKNNKIEGLVYASFVVEPSGVLTNLRIVQSVNKDLDNELLRIIRLMPNNWKAGTKNNTNVRSKYILPLKFSLIDN